MTNDKFAVLRKSVDSDWTVVAVWDTWQEADRDCEERRKNEADEAMYTWEKVTDPVDYWHTHETGMSLREFLGMTAEQYEEFLIQGDNKI